MPRITIYLRETIGNPTKIYEDADILQDAGTWVVIRDNLRKGTLYFPIPLVLQISVTPREGSEEDRIKEIVSTSGGGLAAIRALRAEFGLCLADAKAMYDKVVQSQKPL